MNTSKPKFLWLYLLLAYDLTWLVWIPIPCCFHHGSEDKSHPLDRSK